MTTATTAFTSLSVPVQDDKMDMSSPTNRTWDDDIDIDFDDYQGGVQLTDDERMVEDGDPMIPTTATDDIMDDDLPGEQSRAQEAVMQDTPHPAEDQPEDEELIDYGDDDDNIFDEPVEDVGIPDVEAENVSANEPKATDTITAEAGSEGLQAPDTDTIGQPTNDSTAADTQSNQLPALSHSGEGQELFEFSEDGLVPPATEPNDEGDDALLDESEATALDFAEHAEVAVEESEAAQPPLTVDTTANSHVDPPPDTPTDTGLHPMIVNYGDLQMPLFRSRHQPEGLLKDDNLASLSLAELIKNCRQRLALKIGEDISKDQEILLSFESMGVVLIEDSRSAFEYSLNDIVEVYTQLHKNDGTEDIPALCLHIKLQLKFASWFSVLKLAAASGHGISSLASTHRVEGRADTHKSQLDLEEDRGEEQEFDGYGYDESTYVEDQTGSGEPYHENQGDDETTGEYLEDDQQGYSEFQNDFETDAQQQEHSAQHITGGENERSDGAQTQSAAALSEIPQTTTNPEHDDTQSGQPASTNGIHATATKDSFPSTSIIEHGDTNNGINGEYDWDDEIDFNDDNLTTHPSDVTAENQEDFSTFLTEYNDVEEKTGPPVDEQATETAEVIRAASIVADTDAEPQHVESEDFPDDPEDDFDDADDQDGEHNFEQYHDAGVEEIAHNDDDQDDDQTDPFGEQQEGFNPDYQPGEDDEQFHTAHAFLQEYEHGPEHLISRDEDDFNANIPEEDTMTPIEGDHNDFDDDLQFDDETTELPQDDVAVPPKVNPVATDSPLGKRSFDESIEAGDVANNKPELKKIRST